MVGCSCIQISQWECGGCPAHCYGAAVSQSYVQVQTSMQEKKLAKYAVASHRHLAETQRHLGLNFFIYVLLEKKLSPRTVVHIYYMH